MVELSDYTILLAEDHEALRKGFVRLLMREGCKVIEAGNGKELYEKAREYEGDLSKLVILADTEMPEMCGDEACRKLLREERFARVIMIGMSGDSSNERCWRGVGVWQTFIYKGISLGIPGFRGNLVSLLRNRINNILSNPSFYFLEDGSYRRV